MKTTFLLATLVSLPLWALSPKQMVKEVETINDQKPTQNCEGEKQISLPLDAIKDINAGKLTFLGRDLFPGNDQNRTCVYKSDTAYILYNNCMGSKKESPATDIEVISFKGGITSFYIQNKDSAIPVSTMNRKDYDMTWRVSLIPTPAVGLMTLAELKKFKENYDATSGGCFVGGTFKAQDMNSKGTCYGGVKSPEWSEAAEKFWKEPTDDWYASQKYLRKTVESTKF